MALRWMEGFEGVADAPSESAAPLNEKYPIASNGNGIVATPGRIAADNGFAWFSNRPSSFIMTGDLTEQDVWISGVGIFAPSFPNPVLFNSEARFFIMQFRTELTSSAEMGVGMDRHGRLFVSRSGAISGANFDDFGSGSVTITQNAWHYIEVKILFAETAVGTVEVRVDGVADPALTFTSKITLPNGGSGARKVNRVRLNHFPNDLAFSTGLDDWYVCDNTGAKNNDFLGNTKVVTKFPGADFGAVAWTRSGGTTNFENVDDQDPDDDATFVESNGGNDIDLYEYANVASQVVTVRGVQIDSRIRTTDALNINYRHKVKSGATTQDLPTKTIGVPSYEGQADVVEDDPDTAASWTGAGIDAAQFGQEAI